MQINRYHILQKYSWETFLSNVFLLSIYYWEYAEARKSTHNASKNVK